MNNQKYLFTSERLGFRNWHSGDLPQFTAMNADPLVMKHFPNTLTDSESANLMLRLQKHYEERGHNYFATEVIETGEWIGFIGLAHQDYGASFCPAVDIGWRLKQTAWGNGYATEGAKRCLIHAFEDLKLDRVVAVCTEQNSKSENVMQKIGMTKMGMFHHPKLKDYPDYERCLWYVVRGL